MKRARRRIEVNLEELDRVLDGAREAPLSESDHGKLRDALHALADLLVRTRKQRRPVQWLGSRKALKPEQSRTTTRHRRPGMAVMEPGRSAAHARSISSTGI